MGCFAPLSSILSVRSGRSNRCGKVAFFSHRLADGDDRTVSTLPVFVLVVIYPGRDPALLQSTDAVHSQLLCDLQRPEIDRYPEHLRHVEVHDLGRVDQDAVLGEDERIEVDLSGV